MRSAESVSIFPGRLLVRPSMTLVNTSRMDNGRYCMNNYVKSDCKGPGIFIVQCFCPHPKLIGVSVMRECEGFSTASSVLLSGIKVIPRIRYYDNACNMSLSITLRWPWIYDDCIVVCDRFHYQEHTCNSVHDPSSRLACTHHATSGAESMNHLWNFSKSHWRLLMLDNLVPFLALRSISLNVRARIR